MRISSLVVVAVLCLFGGCATEHYLTDARHPEVAITSDGGLTYRGRFIDPEDLPGLLKDSGLTKEDTINIHVPVEMTDYRMARKVMGILSRNGFTRPILLGDRQSSSAAGRTASQRRREEVLRRRQSQNKTQTKVN